MQLLIAPKNLTVHSEKSGWNGCDISGGGAGIPQRDLQHSAPVIRKLKI